MSPLIFGDLKVIGANNRLEKIRKHGSIEVNGLRFSNKNPGYKITHRDGGVEIKWDYVGVVEKLIFDGTSIEDTDGNLLEMDDYDLIAEFWEYYKTRNSIFVYDEFIVKS